MQEQLIRKVTSIGNGAHVFVPREWLNEELIVTRKPLAPLKERILQKLQNHLPNIEGIYLYGSQARGEATTNSDIDLLLITSEPFKIVEKGWEIMTIEKEKFTQTYTKNVLFITALLSEAQPIMNASLLTELRANHPFSMQKQEACRKEIQETLKKQEQVYALSEKTEGKLSEALLYSVFLRLRSTYWIECLKQKKQYHKEAYILWLQKITNQSKAQITEMEKKYTECKQKKVLKQTTLPLKSIRPYLDALHTLHDKS